MTKAISSAVCSVCNGSGYSQTKPNQRCATCNGRGLVEISLDVPDTGPQFDLEYSAPQCGPHTLIFEFSGYGPIDASKPIHMEFAQAMLLRLGGSRFKIKYDDGTVITGTRK